MRSQRHEHLTFVQETFTHMHLLQLARTVKEIDCKAFTMAVAESLRVINNPPIIMGSEFKINVPGDGK